MRKRALWAILAAVLALGLLGAAAMAMATSGDTEPAIEQQDHDDGVEGPDVPITGPALEQATAAALGYLGEGRVTDTEVGDEESYYEVEVTLDDGTEIDVQLDEQFNVVGTD